MPNRWTFKIPPIQEILAKYVQADQLWIDPFSGYNSPATITNDINQDCPTKYHMLAEDFCKMLPDMYDGIIFDPPYSATAVSRLYHQMQLKVNMDDTNANFYWKVKRASASKIKIGGYAICFGWNSNGFGKNLGFELVEIYLIAHGSSRNDTIVTVERRVR